MDFVEPQRPKTGCVITTAMDIVEPLWPETGSVITTAMDIVEPQWPETGSLIKTTAMDAGSAQRCGDMWRGRFCSALTHFAPRPSFENGLLPSSWEASRPHNPMQK